MDNGWQILDFFGKVNYSVMTWADTSYWWCWAAIIFIGSLVGMSPLSSHHEHTFLETLSVFLRKGLLIVGFGLFILPFIMLYVYDMTTMNELFSGTQAFLQWFLNMTQKNGWSVIPAFLIGYFLRFSYNRYFLTLISKVKRYLRNTQSEDSISDIVEENAKYKSKDFLPNKYYKEGFIFIALDEHNKPIYVPLETWRETNSQIVGPTRYGKGVIIGALIDQVIRMNDMCVYIDPKDDTFAKHLMYQACQATGRKFYYVSLHDDDLGSWAPFTGGVENDAFSRLLTAFNLEKTGDPGTDYYKGQETKVLRPIFSRTRRIEGILNEMSGLLESSSAEAGLEVWSTYTSLNPKPKKGFSVEQAIKENAVVYFQGSLDDQVIKTATKMFIVELIQELRRLKKTGEKKSHATVIVDEVSFLVSEKLREALATIVGFGVNFVNAYQSPSDLENTDDVNLNGKTLRHSVDVNSQIKAIYGGADFETAEWAANLSGKIRKEVTKSEQTDIKTGGAEMWDKGRTIGTVEENLIPTNVVLTLPKRVCVFVQPQQLMKVAFTSFVPVDNMEHLNEFLDAKKKPSQIKLQEKTQEKHEDLMSDVADNIMHFQRVNSDALNQADSDSSISKEVLEVKKEHTPYPTLSSESLEDTNSKDNEGLEVSHAKPRAKEVETEDQEAPEKINRSQKNKARREKQKQKKKEAAKALDAQSPHQDTSTTSPVNVTDLTIEEDDEDEDLSAFLSSASKPKEKDIATMLSTVDDDAVTLKKMHEETEVEQ
ncbi:type IV secretory system conjugative DNA transfer family protein [Algicola sagamiensis]|uniref:type IV secretory system conjugative DNA transfer family protein n=1 Tax=Algicola sagamiensis TaxID=163869 RepID=UPI000380A7F8|nr:TraM recognition domain-containing protein [Algicola sagamiensis]